MTDLEYYASGKMPYIERAILMKDIELKKYFENPTFNLKYFDPIKKSNPTCEYGIDTYWDFNFEKEYKFVYDQLPNYIEAPFHIPIFAALYNGGDPYDSKTGAPSKRGFKGDSINASTITSSNYINLKIPRYILMQYAFNKDTSKNSAKKIIKKNTEFLICSVGGQMIAENIRIIGLWTI